jgi:hypothetical protein
MNRIVRVALCAVGLLLGACASTSFTASWRASDEAPLQVQGSRVVAMAMVDDGAFRRVAEDTLAREIGTRGAIGIPMYSLSVDVDPRNEEAVRQALQDQGIAAVIVLRPIAAEKEVVVDPAVYSAPRYGGFWGDGYFHHGWSAPWAPGVAREARVRTKDVVWVETLLYSLRQNKRVWAGQSRTTDPSSVEELVKELSEAAARQLFELGLIA